MYGTPTRPGRSVVMPAEGLPGSLKQFAGAYSGTARVLHAGQGVDGVVVSLLPFAEIIETEFVHCCRNRSSMYG